MKIINFIYNSTKYWLLLFFLFSFYCVAADRLDIHENEVDTFSPTISGPGTVCSGNSSSYRYIASGSCYSKNIYTWSCNNCEIFDAATATWVTSLRIAYDGGKERDIRFLNSADTTAQMTVLGENCNCNCYWSRTISFEPNPPTLTLWGDNKLMNCGSYSNQYNIAGLSDTWYASSWDVHSGLTLVSTNSTSANVKASNSSSSGYNNLLANVRWRDSNNQTCGYTSVSKSINVVTKNLTVTGQVQICPGGLYQYYAKSDGAVEPFPGATYSWTFPSGYYSLNGTTSYSLNLQAPQSNPNVGAEKATVTFACGTLTNRVNIYPYSYGGYSYSATPNPITNSVSIEIEEAADPMSGMSAKSSNSSKEVTTFEIVLLNEAGEIVKSITLKAKTSEIDVSYLNPDIYYLKVFANNTQIGETQRIVKK